MEGANNVVNANGDAVTTAHEDTTMKKDGGEALEVWTEEEKVHNTKLANVFAMMAEATKKQVVLAELLFLGEKKTIKEKAVEDHGLALMNKVNGHLTDEGFKTAVTNIEKEIKIALNASHSKYTAASVVHAFAQADADNRKAELAQHSSDVAQPHARRFRI